MNFFCLIIVLYFTNFYFYYCFIPKIATAISIFCKKYNYLNLLPDIFFKEVISKPNYLQLFIYFVIYNVLLYFSYLAVFYHEGDIFAQIEPFVIKSKINIKDVNHFMEILKGYFGKVDHIGTTKHEFHKLCQANKNLDLFLNTFFYL